MDSLPRALALTLAAILCHGSIAAESLRFSFGDEVIQDFTRVKAGEDFEASRGFGFEPGSQVQVIRGAGPGHAASSVTSDRPFLFTALLPHEGNWRVSVTLGAPGVASSTTIKAELRRLMIEGVETTPDEHRKVTFVVNTRTPRIKPVPGVAAGEVRLKAPRETVQEAWAWDQAITLEFAGNRPCLRSIEFEPAEVPTVFLLGDSTVCDQPKEPFSSWGQMITRWFKPTVAIANHGESGESYRDSIARRRLDKIVSLIREGDWLLMQFGHNDQKQITSGKGGPFTTYKEEIRYHVTAVRSRGGRVVIIAPMERRALNERGEFKQTLGDYAQAACEAARELNIPFIDLNLMSRQLYEALGVDGSTRAFAHSNGKIDNTHHNNFGSYELAKCIVAEIRRLGLPLADYIKEDFKGFDPKHPDDPAAFNLPTSGEVTNLRPLGDELVP